jgi:hypothetical protein
MAWNPSPEVALARDLAAKLGVDQVMIVTMNYAKEEMGLITYGRTRALCDTAKELGDKAYAAVRTHYAENF